MKKYFLTVAFIFLGIVPYSGSQTIQEEQPVKEDSIAFEKELDEKVVEIKQKAEKVIEKIETIELLESERKALEKQKKEIEAIKRDMEELDRKMNVE